MNISIRSETVQDYFKIAEVHALAFTHDYGMGEVMLVDALRHRPNFDPQLSLVAEYGGEIVGHVLFNPLQMIVGGKEHKVVNLAPIAIHPAYQKGGVGKLLIEEGHKRCIEKGYDFSILLGHPDYYPRFGYQTGTYGSVSIAINRKNITEEASHLKARRVEHKDLGFLISTWEMMFAKEDLSIKPSNSVISWISTSKKMTSAIIEDDASPIGYIRYETNRPANISYFLAKDSKASRLLIQFLNGLMGADAQSITLPIHPNSDWVKSNISYPYEAQINAWGAGMINIFNPENREIAEYCQKVKSDSKQIGLIHWPIEFDIC
ncbi:GNAT family N-acetyltransferase [Pseudoneobacillus sp. C159]